MIRPPPEHQAALAPAISLFSQVSSVIADLVCGAFRGDKRIKFMHFILECEYSTVICIFMYEA